MSEIREDYLPGCGYKIYQDPAEFTFTTDSVFLAHFPHLANKAKVLELGCGTGAISFYLAARGAAEVTGLDVNPRMVELFNRSAEANGIYWQEETGATEMKAEVRKRGAVSVTDDSVSESKELAPKVHALEWDIKEIKSFCPTESFDLVVANPPYRNSGRERTIGTSACHEKTAVLEDFLRPPVMRCTVGGVLPWCSCRNASWNPWNWLSDTTCSPKNCSGSMLP